MRPQGHLGTAGGHLLCPRQWSKLSASPRPHRWRKAEVSPLLARPSHPELCARLKQVAKAPGASAKPRAGAVPQGWPQSPRNDKAAHLIEELTSIFREAAKPRTRSPDGSPRPQTADTYPLRTSRQIRGALASRSLTRGRAGMLQASQAPRRASPPPGTGKTWRLGPGSPEPGHHPQWAQDVPGPAAATRAHHPTAPPPPAAPGPSRKPRSQEVAGR